MPHDFLRAFTIAFRQKLTAERQGNAVSHQRKTDLKVCGSNKKAGESVVNVLSIDIGGTYVKVLASGQTERRRLESGLDLTPGRMVAGREATDKGLEI